MIFFSWRCLSALVAVYCVAPVTVSANEGWSAVFPGLEGENHAAGFAVGDGRHVVAVALFGEKADGGELRFAERKLPAEVFVDPVSRLVVFRMTGPPGKALPLLPEAALRSGTVVQCPGGPAGKIDGWVKRINGKILPLSLLKVDYAGKAPLPGSPLTDGAGRVIAVAHQTIGENDGYALPAEVVKRVVDDVQRGGRVSRGWIGLNLHPNVAVPQVTQVQAGSPSDQAGVMAGDVLLEVGSKRLGDYADAVNAFYFLRPGLATPLRLKRAGQEISVSVVPVEQRTK